jgi:hypothetical protein
VDLTANQANDFGHGDIFLAQNAQTQVWEGILAWLTSARCQSDSDCSLVRDNDSCQCLADEVGAPSPIGTGTCLVDPCLDKAPACQNHQCVVAGGGEEM